MTNRLHHRVAMTVLAATAMVACAVVSSASEDDTTGIAMAPKLTGIKSAVPDKHRVLADGTFDTYSTGEKWQFATELVRVIAPDTPVPEFPARDTGGLPEEDRKALEDRDSRAVMFFIRTMDVLVRSSADAMKVVNGGTETTELDVTNAILALLEGHNEIDALRAEHMKDRADRPLAVPPPGKPTGAPDDADDTTQGIGNLIICHRRLLRCVDDVVEEVTQAFEDALAIRVEKDEEAEEEYNDCMSKAGGDAGAERRCRNIYFGQLDDNLEELQDTAFEAAKKFQRELAICLGRFMACAFLLPAIPLPFPFPFSAPA